MINRLTCCALLSISLLTTVVPAQARPRPTTVERVTFHGWNDAYRISNGKVDVVVVPSIGRIMEYCFTGHPETSPIWINPTEEGKPNDGTWRNYGGDKVWPAPQGDWGKYMHQDRNWPPDPAIDPGHYTLTRINDGVRLVGTPSAAFGIAITRQIVLRPGSPRVQITDRFTRPKTAKDNTLPIGIWGVTQTRGDETAYLPFDSRSKTVHGGFVAINEGTPDAKFRGVNWTIGHGVLIITTKGLKRGNKVGADDTKGTVSERDPHGIVFMERFAYVHGGRYLDNGTDAQVYANDNPAYLEIEAHSSGRVLKPGDSMSRTITWTLNYDGVRIIPLL